MMGAQGDDINDNKTASKIRGIGPNSVTLDLCNTHTSGNIACFNYSVFTHKLQSARGL